MTVFQSRTVTIGDKDFLVEANVNSVLRSGPVLIATGAGFSAGEAINSAVERATLMQPDDRVEHEPRSSPTGVSALPGQDRR